jgi:hypothetical protein
MSSAAHEPEKVGNQSAWQSVQQHFPVRKPGSECTLRLLGTGGWLVPAPTLDKRNERGIERLSAP